MQLAARGPVGTEAEGVVALEARDEPGRGRGDLLFRNGVLVDVDLAEREVVLVEELLEGSVEGAQVDVAAVGDVLAVQEVI